MGTYNAQRGLKAALLAGAMFCMAAPAFAQNNATTVEDIVVTAQRRSERLQDVPISITALSSGSLDRSGVTATTDLARVVPGLQFPMNGGYLQPTIRGISSGGSQIGDSSNVAIYVDGVYQPAQSAQLMDLPDVQQIEVLKGPQGTLYGQNAMGGAIIVTTQSPTFQPSGKLSASYGNYNDINLRGFVSGPIVADLLAASISASYQDRGGFRRQLVYGGHDDGLRSKQVRAKLLFTPNADTQITATAYWLKRGDTAPFSGQAYQNRSLGYLFHPTSPKATSPKDTTVGTYVDNTTESWGATVRGEFNTDVGTFNSITGYQNVHINNSADVDYSAANIAWAGPINQTQRSISQELNFVTKEFSGFTMTLGVFALNGEDAFRPSQLYLNAANPILARSPLAFGVPATVVQSTVSAVKKEIYAGYAELTYNATDKIVVSVGGRYSYEKQNTSSNVFPTGGVDSNVYSAGAFVNPNFTTRKMETPYSPGIFKKFTPRVTARYKLDDQSNIYATYSKGFKSGLTSSDFSTPSVEPEDLTAYEVGFKGRPLQNVSVNISAFHYTYKNKQVARYVTPRYLYQNAASAKVKGVDADVTWAATSELTLTAAASLIDGNYSKFPGAQTAPLTLFGTSDLPVDASGYRMERAPKFSGTLSADYHHDFEMGRIGLFGSAYHNSGYKLDIGGYIRQPSYTTFDAELSFAPSAMDGLRLVLWGKNLSNKAVFASHLATPFAMGVSYQAPRTFGVRAEYAFQ